LQVTGYKMYFIIDYELLAVDHLLEKMKAESTIL